MGPVGRKYANPEKYSWAHDLSYDDSELIIVNQTHIFDEIKKPNAEQAHSKETWEDRLSKKDILAKYLPLVDSVLQSRSGDRSCSTDSPHLDERLLKVFNQATYGWLELRGLDVTDLMDWAWILTAETGLSAAHRLHAVAHRSLNGENVFEPLPTFLFTFLLRRQDIDTEALDLLVKYAWKAMLRLENFNEYKITRSILQGIISAAPVIRDGINGMSHRSFTVMVIRLLRHAVNVCPHLCENVVTLLCRYLDGRNFQKPKLEAQAFHSRRQITHVYNTVLKMLGRSSQVHPLKSVIFQERAQFKLRNRMTQFKPPLTCDQRGAQGIAHVLLMSQKTLGERKWAQMKSLSWPPWKEDRDGMDATIGIEYGVSRAKEALNKMKEAGYAPGEWEQAASILSGWDTDNSPTIQSRSILNPTKASPHMKLPDHSKIVWASRIRATRTLEEAWSCFLACKDQMDSSHLGESVYHAMFVKIDQKAKKQPFPSKPIFTDVPVGERPMPGDGLEIWSPPESPREAIYIRRAPPTADDLFQEMQDDNVRPSGRLLHFLLTHAWTFEAGVRSLKASVVPPEHVSLLLEGKVTEKSFQDINSDLLDAFIAFLARFAPVMPDNVTYPKNPDTTIRTGTRVDSYEDFESHEGPQSPRTSTVKERRQRCFNPLTRAMWILNARHIHRAHTWNHVLAALARPKAVTTLESKVRRQRQADLKTWKEIRKILHVMAKKGVHLDMDGFNILCNGLEKAIFAAERLLSRMPTGGRSGRRLKQAVHHVLDEGLPFLKRLFRDIAGATEAKTLQELPDYPRLLRVPAPGDLHAYIRVLGLRRDYDGLLKLVKWMSIYADEIAIEAQTKKNGRRMTRRYVTAVRVFLERSWMEIRCAEIRVAAAKPELIEEVYMLIIDNEQWGGWPTDDEVRDYCAHGRFL